jgi:hypothetical protein
LILAKSQRSAFENRNEQGLFVENSTEASEYHSVSALRYLFLTLYAAVRSKMRPGGSMVF